MGLWYQANSYATVGSVSRRAFSFFRLTFFRLGYSGPPCRQSSRFYSFVLFLDAVGVREYCYIAVESRLKLCASCVLREQRVLHAR